MLWLQSNRWYFIPVLYVYINKRKKARMDSFPYVYLVTITIFTYASKNKSLPYLFIQGQTPTKNGSITTTISA